MPAKPYLIPAAFPKVSQRWRDTGNDPRQFFNQDGTVDAEFFFQTAIEAREAAARAAAPTPCTKPAPFRGSFALLVTTRLLNS